MTMDELKPKQSAYIRSVGGAGALRHHLLDMGLTPKTEVTLQKIAPMGAPVQIELRGRFAKGYTISLMPFNIYWFRYKILEG